MPDPEKVDEEVEKFIADNEHLKHEHIRLDLQGALDQANSAMKEAARALHVAPQNPEVTRGLKKAIREALDRKKAALKAAEALKLTIKD